MYGKDQSGSDCDDEDLDDELGLPYVLANIGLKEKRELFQFKKTHTDVSVLLLLPLIFNWACVMICCSDFHSITSLELKFISPNIT